jgi:hypothetical protein
MKRNFNVPVLDFEGRAHVRTVNKIDEKGVLKLDEKNQAVFSHFEPMTLRTYAMDALAGRWRGEDQMSVKDAVERMRIYDKLAAAQDGEVDISSEEGKLIVETALRKGDSAMVIARLQMLIDTDPVLRAV